MLRTDGVRQEATRAPRTLSIFFLSFFSSSTCPTLAYVIFVDFCMSWFSIPGICFQGVVLLFYYGRLQYCDDP